MKIYKRFIDLSVLYPIYSSVAPHSLFKAMGSGGTSNPIVASKLWALEERVPQIVSSKLWALEVQVTPHSLFKAMGSGGILYDTHAQIFKGEIAFG